MTRKFNDKMVLHARMLDYRYWSDNDLAKELKFDGGNMHDDLGMLRLSGDYEIYEWFKLWMTDAFRIAMEMNKRGL